MKRKSRYSNSLTFSYRDRAELKAGKPTDGETYKGDGGTVFQGLRPRDIKPATGILEHTVASGDRLDRVSGHYFEKTRLWYRIVDANPKFLFAPDMFLDLGKTGVDTNDHLQREDMIGHTILIPKGEE